MSEFEASSFSTLTDSEIISRPFAKQCSRTTAIRDLFAAVASACGPFERVTFIYLTWLVAIFAIFHAHIDHPLRKIIAHLAIAVAIAGVCAASTRSTTRVLQFARHWYPLPLYIFFFEELGTFVHAIFPGWYDHWLIAFDYSLAGVHPSVWLARFATPALNDYMQFAYMTYFLYLVILPAILYANDEMRSFWTVMTSTAIAHYTVYVIAILFPIESPHFALASLHQNSLAGGYCTAMINFIERFGRVHGAAFPSAHVAGSMVAIVASWRYRRWLFWLCLPFFASMCVATVYGRYHYVADVFAGLILGWLAFETGTAFVEAHTTIKQPVRLEGTDFAAM